MSLQEGVDRCPTLTADGGQKDGQLERQPSPHDVCVPVAGPWTGPRNARSVGALSSTQSESSVGTTVPGCGGERDCCCRFEYPD